MKLYTLLYGTFWNLASVVYLAQGEHSIALQYMTVGVLWYILAALQKEKNAK